MTAKPEDLIRLLRGRSTDTNIPQISSGGPMTTPAEKLIERLRIGREYAQENGYLHKAVTEAAYLLEELLAQNRRLQDELEKAKADLGARNRILTEEP